MNKHFQYPVLKISFTGVSKVFPYIILAAVGLSLYLLFYDKFPIIDALLNGVAWGFFGLSFCFSILLIRGLIAKMFGWLPPIYARSAILDFSKGAIEIEKKYCMILGIRFSDDSTPNVASLRVLFFTITLYLVAMVLAILLTVPVFLILGVGPSLS